MIYLSCRFKNHFLSLFIIIIVIRIFSIVVIFLHHYYFSSFITRFKLAVPSVCIHHHNRNYEKLNLSLVEQHHITSHHFTSYVMLCYISLSVSVFTLHTTSHSGTQATATNSDRLIFFSFHQFSRSKRLMLLTVTLFYKMDCQTNTNICFSMHENFSHWT